MTTRAMRVIEDEPPGRQELKSKFVELRATVKATIAKSANYE